MNNYKKRVSPLFIAETLISGMIRFLIPGVIIVIKERSVKVLMFAGAFFILMLLIAIIKYFRTTYEVTKGHIIYRTGVFSQKEKYISLADINSFDTSASAIYQVFSLVSLDINILNETVKIKPISKKEAQLIINSFNEEKSSEISAENEKQNIIYALSFKTLSFLAILEVRVFIVISIFFAFYNKIRDLLDFIFDDKHILDKFLEKNSKSLMDNITSIIEVLAVVMVLGVIISMCLTIVKFYNFTLVSKDNNLICKYGLLNKKSIAIDKDKIQSIKVEYPFRFRLFGLAKLSVVLLTNKVSEDLSEKMSVDIIPLAKVENIDKFLKTDLNLVMEDYSALNYEKISSKARSIMYRWSIFNGLVIFIAFALIPENKLSWNYKIILSLCAYILFLIQSIAKKNFDLRNTKIAFNEEKFIYTQTRGFKLIVEYVNIGRVRSIETSGNIFLERKDLAHIKINCWGINSDIRLDYFNKKYKEKLEKTFLKGDSYGNI